MQNIYLHLGIYTMLLFCIIFYTKNKASPPSIPHTKHRYWWQTVCSKFAQTIGLARFVSYSGYAYQYGIWTYVILLGFLIGYTLFTYWVIPKIHSLSKRQKFCTQGDLVGYKTKSIFSKQITDIFAALSKFTWLLVATIAGGMIIENIGILQYEYATAIVLTIASIYILLGSYKAKCFNDISQGLIIVTLTALISYPVIREANIPQILHEQIGYIQPPSIIGFFLYGIFIIFGLADRYEMGYIEKNKKNIQKGMFFTTVPIIIVASILLLIGLSVHIKNPILDPSVVFVQALRIYTPSIFIPFGIILFLAGLINIASKTISIISSNLSFLAKQEKNPKNIKVISIIIIVLTYIVSYFFRNVIEVTTFGACVSIVMSVPMIYIIQGGKKSYKFIASIIGGVSSLLVGIIVLGINPSLILVVLIGSSIGLLYNHNKVPIKREKNNHSFI